MTVLPMLDPVECDRACPYVTADGECGQVSTVVVPEAGLVAYNRGALVQDAFPELSLTDRERFKTGYCPRHMALLFGA